MFNLSQVSEESNAGKRLYVYPGVMDVTINGWVSGVNPNGKPFIELEVTSVDAIAEGTQNASKKFQFYLTDTAKDNALRNIKHIITKVTKAANIKDVASVEEFTAMINALSKGKSLRMKFIGEEYEYNGDIKVAARIGLPAFAEAIVDGAEYPAVALENTKLTYDKTNKYDFKPFAKDSSSVSSATTAPSEVAW